MFKVCKQKADSDKKTDKEKVMQYFGTCLNRLIEIKHALSKNGINKNILQNILVKRIAAIISYY